MPICENDPENYLQKRMHPVGNIKTIIDRRTKAELKIKTFDAEEIRQLRGVNEILAAKVEVMDLFALVLRTQPNYPSRGMGEDVLWKLECCVSEFEKEKAKAKQGGVDHEQGSQRSGTLSPES